MSGARPKVIPCASCGKHDTSRYLKAMVAGRWVCASCIPAPECAVCGAPCWTGIERHAIGNMDSDSYGLRQAIVAVCHGRLRHITTRFVQWGPGAVCPGTEA